MIIRMNLCGFAQLISREYISPANSNDHLCRLTRPGACSNTWLDSRRMTACFHVMLIVILPILEPRSFVRGGLRHRLCRGTSQWCIVVLNCPGRCNGYSCERSGIGFTPWGVTRNA